VAERHNRAYPPEQVEDCGYVLCLRQAIMLRLLSGRRHAHAAIVIGSAAMRWLPRADLGIEEIAYRTAQNLSSLHRRFHANGRTPPNSLRSKRPVAPKTIASAVSAPAELAAGWPR
jgi:hypothetical protein